MTNKNGFTLIEIIVVMIIIGILVAFAVPNYITYMQQGAANAAEYNLITIYNAQKNYLFNHNKYCLKNTPAQSSCMAIATKCAGTTASDYLAAINCNLKLNINDNNFTYLCESKTVGVVPKAYCTATNPSGLTLALTLFANSVNQPICLPGSTTCTPNPKCTPAGSPFCPNAG